MLLQRDVAPGVHRIEDAWVNWYLVEGPDPRDPLTAVDAGLPRSWRSLRTALGQLGRSLDDLGAVVLTHGHFDHVGFAERARRELGVPVWTARDEAVLARRPLHFNTERRTVPYVLRNPKLLRVGAEMVGMGGLASRGVRHARAFEWGEVLDVPCGLVAIPTPGHTAGHTSFLLPDRNVVISGDALVSFDPYTGRHGPRLVSRAASTDTSLATRSLERLMVLDVEAFLPGHGPPWRGSIAEACARAAATGAG